MIYVVTYQTLTGLSVYFKTESESHAKELLGPASVMRRLWHTAPEGYRGPCMVVCMRDPFGKQSPVTPYANEYKTASRARKVIEGLPRVDKDLGMLSDPWPLLALPSEIKRWQSKAK